MLNAIEREILEAARKSIQNGNHRYVCYAIRDATIVDATRKELAPAKDRLTEYVETSLGIFSTLGTWLASRGHGTSRSDYNDFLREARIAWISWMLGELDVSGTPPKNLRN